MAQHFAFSCAPLGARSVSLGATGQKSLAISASPVQILVVSVVHSRQTQIYPCSWKAEKLSGAHYWWSWNQQSLSALPTNVLQKFRTSRFLHKSGKKLPFQLRSQFLLRQRKVNAKRPQRSNGIHTLEFGHRGARLAITTAAVGDFNVAYSGWLRADKQVYAQKGQETLASVLQSNFSIEQFPPHKITPTFLASTCLNISESTTATPGAELTSTTIFKLFHDHFMASIMSLSVTVKTLCAV